MGLFDKAKKALADRAKAEIGKAVGRDMRPPIPDDELAHWRNECVRVSVDHGAFGRLESLGRRPSVLVRKRRNEKYDADYVVSTTDGETLGWLSANDFMRTGAKTRGTTQAEVRMPEYQNDKYAILYIPITEEAKRRKEMTIWFNVPESRWSGPSERVDEVGGEILESRRGSGKPTYVITAGGLRICEVTSRMSCYAKVAERAGERVRRAIAEPRDGEHGRYWHVGLYF